MSEIVEKQQIGILQEGNFISSSIPHDYFYEKICLTVVWLYLRRLRKQQAIYKFKKCQNLIPKEITF